MSYGYGTDEFDEAAAPVEIDVDQIIAFLLDHVSDGYDHPELWPELEQFVALKPGLIPELQRLASQAAGNNRAALIALVAACQAAAGDLDAATRTIAPEAARHSLSPLVQGVVFFLESRRDPANPKYDLAGKLCTIPFEQIDVLDGSSHLCCASYLKPSVGNLATTDWRSVWNSPAAQDIRESIHDGSYRFCNKTACPEIQANALKPADELAARSTAWAEIVEARRTSMAAGPATVNLAYDRSCNLSCPSCRTSKYAADSKDRERFREMQQKAILPMLREADTVFITGSGDPFASKNFRQLMTELTPEEYPDLRFQVMTNGMLLTRREWERFPSLHGRVKRLRISIDAATGPTHELLRRGAKWDVMLETMAFAGELLAAGLVERYELAFTVQVDNYAEMGDAVDLARTFGANEIEFSRLTNWGTFSDADYAAKAVFLPSHPQHEAFVAAINDPRLRLSIVELCDLTDFQKVKPI